MMTLRSVQVAWVALLATAALSGQGGSQILESECRVGGVALGRKPPSSPPKAIVLQTDRNGTVRAITVTTSGMFTQRFVTVGQSTVQDVLKRYGKASDVRREGNQLAFVYNLKACLIAFGVNISTGVSIPVEQRSVVFVSLRAR